MSADPSILQAALIGYQHQRDQIDAKMAEIRLDLWEDRRIEADNADRD
jgi:hypothetical protein